ncbi:outer membrane beta-barrel protein [Sulfurimonas sp.]|uniref:outer membrane beta-barrel protein n=1 Tax=Sulfurimonas sp. TaxID=2022749 RepID=UPI002B48240D|nr:outer membrane beta-barrel protein [Sulfurimonas sp.]
MKKIILLALILTSLYSNQTADKSKVYVGLSGGYMNEAFSDDAKTTGSAKMAKFKIGYGIRTAYAIEFSIDYLKNTSNVFSTLPAKDGDKYGLNVELIKGFNWDIFINPYFKAGIGTGIFDIKYYSSNQNSLNYSSFNLGLGFFIPINEHLDFEVGYDYKYVSYRKLISSNQEILKDLNSNINGVYIGINARF